MATNTEGLPIQANMKTRLLDIAISVSHDTSLESLRGLVRAAIGPVCAQTASDLFDVFEQSVQNTSNAQYKMLPIILAAAGLEAIVSQGKAHILQQFLDSCFLPLLCSNQLPSQASYLQVSKALCSLMVQYDDMKTLSRLLDSCAVSVGAELSKHNLAATQQTAATSLPTASYKLPFHTSCVLVPSLLHACTAIITAAAVDVQGSEGVKISTQADGMPAGMKALLSGAVDSMLAPALTLLSCSSNTTRQAALRALLPSLLSAAQATGVTDKAAAAVQAVCCTMLPEPGAARRAGLAALVQAVPLLKSCYHSDSSGSLDVEQVTGLPRQLSQQLAICLASEDPLDRKRSSYLLQQLMPTELQSQPAWQSWFSLHSLLEEFGMHLIKPAWVQVNSLHAVDPQHAGTESAVVNVSHPRNKLRGRKAKNKQQQDESAQDGDDASKTDTGSGATGSVLPMSWLCVIWQRGLQHINCQVQRLALRSFFQRHWHVSSSSSQDTGGAPPGSRSYKDVPAAFLCDVLIPALVQDWAYDGYRSAFDCQAAATLWLSTWFQACPDQASHRSVAEAWLAALTAKGVTRGSLHRATGVWSNCCQSAGALHTDTADAWSQKQVSKLDMLCTAILNHQGATYKTDMYRNVLLAAPHIVPVQHVGTSAALHLLGNFPVHSVAIGGDLNVAARQYISGTAQSSMGTGYVEGSANRNLCQDLLQAWQRFDVDWPRSKAFSEKDIQDVARLCKAPALVCCLLANDAAGRDLVACIKQATSDLAALYNRTAVPAVSVVKRLQLLHELFSLGLNLAPRISPDTVILEPLISLATATCTASANFAKLHIANMFTNSNFNHHADNAPLQQERALLCQAAMKACCSMLSFLGTATITAPTSNATAMIINHRQPSPSSQSIHDLVAPISEAINSFVFLYSASGCKVLELSSDGALSQRKQSIEMQLDMVHACAAALTAAMTSSGTTRDDLMATAQALSRNVQASVTACLRLGCGPQPSTTSNLGPVLHLRWPALAALLTCCATATSSSRPIISFHADDLAAGHNSTSHHADDHKIKSTTGGGKLISTGVGDLPQGLSVLLQLELLSEALDALECLEGDELSPVLSIVRAIWASLHTQCNSAQIKAAVDLTTEASESEARVALAWKVVRAVCSCTSASNKRRSSLCAAVVNTVLLPCVFVTSEESVGQSLLHAKDGPMQWGLKRLMDWGSGSPRIMLLISAQLSSLLMSCPALLLDIYADAISRLLLYGSGKAEQADSYDLEGQDNEASMLTTSLGGQVTADPQATSLMCQVSGTEIAPRAMILSALYQVCKQSGSLWTPAVSSDPKARTYTGASKPKAASSKTVQSDQQAGVSSGVKQQQQQKPDDEGGDKKKPVIIFHDTGDWEPINSISSGGQQEISNTRIDTAAAAAGGGNATSSVSRVQAGLAALGSLSASTSPLPTGQTTVNNREAGVSTTTTQHTQHAQPRPVTAQQEAVLAAGAKLWQQSLDFALKDPSMSTDKIKFGSEIHRKKVRLWQALVVLSNFVTDDHIIDAVTAVLGQFSTNEAPSVKQYQEAVAAALLLRRPDLVESQLLPLMTSYERHHPGVGSFILVAAQVILHSDPTWQPRILPPLLMAMSPWLTCHTHNVRTFAQLMTHALLDTYPADHPIWDHSQADVSYLRHFMAFFDTNHDLLRLRRTIGGPLLLWSPVGLTAPSRILGPGVSLAGQPEANLAFEGAPPTLMDRITSFLMNERYRLREEITDRLADIEFLDGNATGLGNAADGAGEKGANVDFQRKVMSLEQTAAVSLGVAGNAAGSAGHGSYHAAASTLHSLWQALHDASIVNFLQMADEHHHESLQLRQQNGPAGSKDQTTATGNSTTAGTAGDDLRTAAKGARQDLIIVASLVDKLPNLAGLARTCEVFRASQLVVPDLRVADDPMFSSISVTAEQWVPMVEVKEAALLAWLEKKQSEGYCLVGLEQTADSVRLHDYSWPAKSVLVLGREKEGMPPEVMSLLDDTVEIPQLGLIRSLNVHVSGAIAMYEYTKQRIAAKE